MLYRISRTWIFAGIIGVIVLGGLASGYWHWQHRDYLNEMPSGPIPALPHDEPALREALLKKLAEYKDFHNDIEQLDLLPGDTREDLHEGVRRLKEKIASAEMEYDTEGSHWFAVDRSRNLISVNLNCFDVLVRYGKETLFHESVHLAPGNEKYSNEFGESLEVVREISKLSAQAQTPAILQELKERCIRMVRGYFLSECRARYYETAMFAVRAGKGNNPFLYSLKPFEKPAAQKGMTLQEYFQWVGKTSGDDHSSVENMFMMKSVGALKYTPHGFSDAMVDDLFVNLVDSPDAGGGIVYIARLPNAFDPEFSARSIDRLKGDEAYRMRYLAWIRQTILKPEDLIYISKN